jgi:hypothetical protein
MNGSTPRGEREGAEVKGGVWSGGTRGCTRGERELGLGRWEKATCWGDVAYLLGAAVLHDADRMADECGRCRRYIVISKKDREEMRDVPMPRLR